MTWDLLIQFLVLTAIVSGGIIFALYKIFISSVDGAKQRLEREADAARAKSAELNRKISEIDQELKKRRAELDSVEKKIRGDLEAQLNKEKEEMVLKARTEAEEIISKAQNARENIRKEIEKTMELKIIDYSHKVLNDVLTSRVKDALDKQLVFEFIDKLKQVDMSKIGSDVQSAELISVRGLDSQMQTDLGQVLQSKLNRTIKLNPKNDPKIIGGVVLQFGSLQLDGSLAAFIKEAATGYKQDVEKK